MHSMHSYFLKPGMPDQPILYAVKETSNGRTFATRSVEAKQGGGNIIFKAQASFQPSEASHVEHSTAMPDVPPPESLPSADERVADLMKDPRAMGEDKTSRQVRDALDAFIKLPYPIEIKHCGEQPDYLDPSPKARPPRRRIWMRTRLPIPDDANLHRCACAFFSDHALLATSLLPHRVLFPGVSSLKLKILASLDHSMWFHQGFRADEWMLYDMESPAAGAGRALSTGRIYSRDGRLCVSVAQEGVVRLRRAGDDSVPITPPML